MVQIWMIVANMGVQNELGVGAAAVLRPPSLHFTEKKLFFLHVRQPPLSFDIPSLDFLCTPLVVDYVMWVGLN